MGVFDAVCGALFVAYWGYQLWKDKKVIQEEKRTENAEQGAMVETRHKVWLAKRDERLAESRNSVELMSEPEREAAWNQLMARVDDWVDSAKRP